MTVAEQVAKILIDTRSIAISPRAPFTLTSGRISPVYADCRRLPSFPKERGQVIAAMKQTLQEQVPEMPFDVIAGGETAGIPYAALLADALDLPMVYIRKKSKKFGRKNAIEGAFNPGDRMLLVEDLASDGGSKALFIQHIRDAGAEVAHCIVVFKYDLYGQDQSPLQQLEVQLHHLTTWRDVLATARANQSLPEEDLSELEKYINDPEGWRPADGGTMTLPRFD